MEPTPPQLSLPHPKGNEQQDQPHLRSGGFQLSGLHATGSA